MKDQYTVGSLIAEFLDTNGIRAIFGIVSVHNLPIMDAIGLRPDLEMVMARGEAGAAHMADGYARASRGLGVVVSSTGPGASNAVAGLLEAKFSSSPVLHITGQTATPHLGRDRGTVHEFPQQSQMLASVSKSSYMVRSPQDCLGILKRAALDATSDPMGPVSVEIPVDVQRAVVKRPSCKEDFLVGKHEKKRPSESEIQRLVEKVKAAKRPMLWVGSGAYDTGDEIAQLLQRGFGMVSSWAGCGIVPGDHPQNLGGLNGVGAPQVQALYEQSDLMLIVGSRVRGHETLDMSIPLPSHRVQIDIDPLADGRNYSNDLFVLGDCQLVLQELCNRLPTESGIDPEFTQAVIETKINATDAFKNTLGPYKDFSETLRAKMPGNAVWCRDVTVSNSTWGNRIFPTFGKHNNIYPTGAGIGQGLCLGIGAAVAAKDRKVVVMTGDGGFFFNVSELWTIVQEQLNILIIVMNDRGYGVIKHMQDAMYSSRRKFGDLTAPDLLELAQLAKIPASRVSAVTDFGAAVEKGMQQVGPYLIEVDMETIGEFPPYFPYSKAKEKVER